jgi:hypothetical protein
MNFVKASRNLSRPLFPARTGIFSRGSRPAAAFCSNPRVSVDSLSSSVRAEPQDEQTNKAVGDFKSENFIVTISRRSRQ